MMDVLTTITSHDPDGAQVTRIHFTPITSCPHCGSVRLDSPQPCPFCGGQR